MYKNLEKKYKGKKEGGVIGMGGEMGAWVARRGWGVRWRGERWGLVKLDKAPRCWLVSIALTVGYLYPYSNSFVCFRFQFRFPSVLFGLASLLASEVRFPLSDFFSLDGLRAVSTRLPGVGTSLQFACCLNTTFNPSFA